MNIQTHALLLVVGLGASLAFSLESSAKPQKQSATIAELEARIALLEAVVVRTGASGENVELRAPSLHGSIALVTGNGDKVVEVQYPVFIPYSVPALGFFGHNPIGQESVQGDWNSGVPDEPNQCFVLGNIADVLGSNVGYGLVMDHRTNY